MPISDQLTTCARAVEARLQSFLDMRSLPARLDEPVRYALLSGGKRIRPALAWLACEAVGADPARSLPAGCAIELVHAFSLVHDDLPAIDNDDLRRGRPALHLHAGEAGAILAGDAMLALAFLSLADVDDAALRAALLAELAAASVRMIEGQVIDVAESPADLDALESMHRLKTGALISASCRMGALCGAASAPQLDQLTRFGDALGLMFQIVDDLLDVEQTSETLGKPAGSDRDGGKTTYPDLIGVKACRSEVERLRLEAKNALADLNADGLLAIIDDLANRTH